AWATLDVDATESLELGAASRALALLPQAALPGPRGPALTLLRRALADALGSASQGPGGLPRGESWAQALEAAIWGATTAAAAADELPRDDSDAQLSATIRRTYSAEVRRFSTALRDASSFAIISKALSDEQAAELVALPPE
ncbi:unnamed protein product, partial [Polarella glacialis]